MGSDGHLENLEYIYRFDNNAVYLIALKIWTEDESGLRRHANYPREVTALATTCWGIISCAWCTKLLPRILLQIVHDSQSVSHTPINIEHALLWTIQDISLCLKSFCCSLSTLVPLDLLFPKKTVTSLAIHPHWTFFHWFAGEIIIFVQPTWYKEEDSDNISRSKENLIDPN